MTIIRPGSLVWHQGVKSDLGGTVGAIVQLKGGADGRRFILSCAHVLAPRDKSPRIGDKILAGDGDGSPIAELIGFTDYVPKQFCVEAAVAEIDRKTTGADPSFENAGPITGTSLFRAKELTLYARGQDDDAFHTATISDASTTRITASASSPTKFGNPGDSGAIALNRFGRAVGMIQSKRDGSLDRYLIPIQVVLKTAALAANLSADAFEIMSTQSVVDLKEKRFVGI